MNIKLYYTPRTRSIRPRWLLEELQLDYKLHPIDLFGGEGSSEAYRRIQPHGCVPAIEIDQQVMFESCAICHWLTDQHPDKQLAPPLHAAERKQYEQWMFYVPGTMEPPVWHMLLHRDILPEKRRVAEIVPWAKKQYESVLRYLESQLQGKEFLLDGHFTSADITLGSTLMWTENMLEPFPALKDYIGRLRQRAAYQRSIDETPPAPDAQSPAGLAQ